MMMRLVLFTIQVVCLSLTCYFLLSLMLLLG